jgi:hypothetical protein
MFRHYFEASEKVQTDFALPSRCISHLRLYRVASDTRELCADEEVKPFRIWF